MLELRPPQQDRRTTRKQRVNKGNNNAKLTFKRQQKQTHAKHQRQNRATKGKQKQHKKHNTNKTHGQTKRQKKRQVEGIHPQTRGNKRKAKHCQPSTKNNHKNNHKRKHTGRNKGNKNKSTEHKKNTNTRTHAKQNRKQQQKTSTIKKTKWPGRRANAVGKVEGSPFDANMDSSHWEHENLFGGFTCRATLQLLRDKTRGSVHHRKGTENEGASEG